MSPMKSGKTGEIEEVAKKDPYYILKPLEWVEYLMANRRINFIGSDILKIYEDLQNPANKIKYDYSSDRTLVFLDLTLYKHNGKAIIM